MSNPPAFQYYAADFDADTATWTNEEVGIYQRLLNYEWINGWNPSEGLPDDPKRLANIVRCSYKKFQKRWIIISKKFSRNGKGFLVNRRLEEEREIQREYRESQSESGKRGVEAKRKRGIFPFIKSSAASTDPLSNPSTDPATGNQALRLQSSLTNIKDIQTLFVFPLRNGVYALGKEKILEYQNTYQNIDIMQTLKECIQWNRDNEARRKTSRGILKHINAWLRSASQNKGYIAKALDMPEHERDMRTAEQKKADMAKFKAFAGATVKKLKRII